MPFQVAALTRAVYMYASHIDDLGKLQSTVERICHKHVSRGVQAPHYDAVGECLLAAMRDVLGDVASEEIMCAWEEAYGFLASLFIETEAKIKAELEEKAGYGSMVSMQVVSSNGGDGEEKIIGLVPVAGKAPVYGKGQFVTVSLTVGDNEKTMDSYKLVDGELGVVTISVRDNKERAATAMRALGADSVVMVSVPCGRVCE